MHVSLRGFSDARTQRRRRLHRSGLAESYDLSQRHAQFDKQLFMQLISP
jgi:hypothetical protein